MKFRISSGSTLGTGLVAIFFFHGLAGKLAIAQVTADSTLQSENSVVTVTTNGGASTYSVTGGASRGNNLFHSFDQFSVAAGDTAVFLNASTIANIISRVTGQTISSLDGLIGTDGNANLFLINPAGIVIGPNAQLDIGGSFLASTANGLRFDNGFIYSVGVPNLPPLLTVSAPVGLMVENAAGDIQMTGQAGNFLSAFAVPAGETLALIGGDIFLTSSQLSAPGGRIELGGIGEAGEITLKQGLQGFDISFGEGDRLSNIQISAQSRLDVTGPGGGTIEVQGETVNITEQSALISDTTGNLSGNTIRVTGDYLSLDQGSFIGAAVLGSGDGSNIEVTTTRDILLFGTGILNYKLLIQANIPKGRRQVSDRQIGGIFTTTTGVGRAGNISLNTQNLRIDEGGVISTESLGMGNSGDIQIMASDSLRMRGSGIQALSLVPGVLLFDDFGIATGLSTIGIPAGAAGNIAINTAQLFIEKGAQVSAATLSDQNSGDIFINASESVVLQDFFAPIPFPTAINTATVGGNGNAGNVLINTGRLIVQDGAEIAANSGSAALQGIIPFGGNAGTLLIKAADFIDIAGSESVESVIGQAVRESFPSSIETSTFSSAPAGVVTLMTPVLNIRQGGRVSSATFGDGSGGAVNINAETINIEGIGGANDELISGIFASSGTSIENRVTTGDLFLEAAADPLPATGRGGNIVIDTRSLTVQDRAGILVGSFSLGLAGNLNIEAQVVRLENQGGLAATTVVGQGGNITVVADAMVLNNSRINATSRSGNGGNLNFNLQDFLVLRNGSLISTEAGTAGAGGNGGDITLSLPKGFIVAVPTENSDVRANAFAGDGGNVTIAARSLLGIAFQPNVLDTPFSDITASSQFGNSGTVTIDELAPDIAQDNVALPAETAPTELAQGCRGQGSHAGSFIITGRGGLPTNPFDPLSDNSVWQDLEPILDLSDDDTDRSPATHVPETAIPDKPLVEAQSWTRAEDGTVVLLANAAATPDYFVPHGCELE